MARSIPPPGVDPWVASRYGSLVFPAVLHQIRNNYRNNLPKFNGEKGSTEDHLTKFQDFIDDFNVEESYVFMRLFV